MAIHEKSLIESERIQTHETLVLDGVDVSGHWNTMVLPRVVSDYDDGFYRIIAADPQAANVHRCWQCGSCTNSCTVYALNTQFNPRYWIYLTNLGLKEELLKDKDIIWQCVSCNKCTNICPKDVRPEGVMKALAHWLEEEGHVPKSRSTIFDDEFTSEVFANGRIEDGHVLVNFLRQTGQSLFQDWLVEFGRRLARHLPVRFLATMGWHFVFAPRTRTWGRTAEVLRAYLREQKEQVRRARTEATRG